MKLADCSFQTLNGSEITFESHPNDDMPYWAVRRWNGEIQDIFASDSAKRTYQIARSVARGLDRQALVTMPGGVR